MASPVIAALQVTLGLNAANFSNGIANATSQLRQTSAKFSAVGAKMAGIGAAMSLAFTTPFIAAGAHLLQGSQDAAAASAQVQAALTSMGNASGKTLEQLQATAEGLRNLTGVDDDEILKKVTSNLLTFGNVSGDVFDRAQQAIVDISARLGGDLQSATMMVGKALNDPIKGLGALRKTGIQFTEQQQKQIIAMTKVGDVAGAQAVMLAELERQFGGAAKAAADADIWTPMKTAMMDLEGAFEPIIRNVVTPAISVIANLTKAFAGLSPTVITLVAVVATFVAVLGPVLVGVGALLSAIGAIGTAFAAGGILASFAGFAAILGPIGLAVAALGAAFWVFRDDIIPTLQKFWKFISETLGPPTQAYFSAIGEVAAALGVIIKDALESDAGQAMIGFATAVSQIIGGTVVAAFKATFQTIGVVIQAMADGLKVLAALMRGDFAGAMELARAGLSRAVQGMKNVFGDLAAFAVSMISRMVQGVSTWLTGKLFDVLGGVIKKVKGVSDAFFKLYDAVVGHSYVPDMVTEVGQWMARLDAEMVVPAKNATEAATTAFETMRDKVAAVFDSLLTEREKLTRGLTADMKVLNDALAAGPERGGITKAQYDEAVAGVQRRFTIANNGIDGENLTMPDTIGTIVPIDTSSINKTMEQINERIAESREKFADAFEYGIDSALRGDWAGVLQAIIGDTFQNAMKNLGRSLFDSLGGGKPGGMGGGFDLGSIGKMAASIFGKIPGFATGGSFRVGGAGGVDSKLVSMRLTPGEMVDIRRPGQLQAANNNTPIHFDLRGAVMTADLLGQMQGMAAQSGGNALQTARTAVPADRAKSSKYSLSGRR